MVQASQGPLTAPSNALDQWAFDPLKAVGRRGSTSPSPTLVFSSLHRSSVFENIVLLASDYVLMTLHYDDTITHPLSTDALIEERVAALVGRACSRQLWFLYLDESQVQLPTIMPVGNPPFWPDPSVAVLARRIQDAMDAIDARSVVIVFERYADAAITDCDRAWARAITDEFTTVGVQVRGMLISHRRGVRWLAQDDFRYGDLAAPGAAVGPGAIER